MGKFKKVQNLKEDGRNKVKKSNNIKIRDKIKKQIKTKRESKEFLAVKNESSENTRVQKRVDEKNSKSKKSVKNRIVCSNLPSNNEIQKGSVQCADEPKQSTKDIDSGNVKTSIKQEKRKIYDPDDIGRTIFVGNLPQSTKKLQLKKLFSNFGEVKSVRLRTADGKKLFKHKTRKEAQSLSAYIVMNDIKDVDKAIQMSGTEFKDRHIRITRARKDTEEIDSKRIVFVGNLKYSATDEKLFEIFSSCGEIEYVRTLQSSKGCKGVAFVCFKKPESVGLALELNNTILDERPIHVERYSKNKLGAHEKRKEEEKQLTGPSRRIKEKNKKLKKIVKDTGDKKIKKSPKKKSEFRGVQVDFKKKTKKKKSKPNQMLWLAKKIAPKS